MLLELFVGLGLGGAMGYMYSKMKSNKEIEKIKEEMHVKFSTPLLRYAKDVKERPFILFLEEDGSGFIIPVTDEIINKKYIKIHGKVYELSTKNAYKLVYFDKDKKRFYNQDFVIYFAKHFMPINHDVVFNNTLLGAIDNLTLSTLDRLYAQLEYLQNKLKDARSPEEVQVLHQKIQQINQLIENVSQVKHYESKNIVPASQVVTPEMTAYLNEKVRENEEYLTDDNLEELVNSLYYGSESEDSKK